MITDEVSYFIDDAAFIGDTVPAAGDIPIYINKKDIILLGTKRIPGRKCRGRSVTPGT